MLGIPISSLQGTWFVSSQLQLSETFIAVTGLIALRLLYIQEFYSQNVLGCQDLIEAYIHPKYRKNVTIPILYYASS